MVSSEYPNPATYYARTGIMTDPGQYARLLDGMPREISDLCKVVQGLLLHVFWAERYGVELSEERKAEVNLRSVSSKLARLLELDDRPLVEARALTRRLVGNCRDFALLLCAILQHQGVPARARCGFGAYFVPGRYEDHWVCEYWHDREQRWLLVDAQLDTFQRQALEIRFDPLDVPRDQFLVGGKAWQLCRAGHANADDFGIFDMHGMWFIRGDLVRDYLALNKIEILPWDMWGSLVNDQNDLAPEQIAFFDHLAVLTLAGDEAFSDIRALYEGDARLRMDPDWPHERV